MGAPENIVSAQPLAPVSLAAAAENAHAPVRRQSAVSSGAVPFERILAQAQSGTVGAQPIACRWRRLGFLTSCSVPRLTWPWATEELKATASAVAESASLLAGKALKISEYPRPALDNGKGIHWIPTVSQTPEVVDRFVDEAVSMGMKWVVFLNDGTDVKANNYLVQRLTEEGIEPLMRVYSAGLTPIEGDIKGMVEHFSELGVHYYQLYNEPNLMVETNGNSPDVNRYLDLWLPAAKQVLAGGGLPGFGALSPQGEVNDFSFLASAFEQIKSRGQANVLDRAWLAMHNYTTGPSSLTSTDGFLRFREYDEITRRALGRSLPIIGTEGGSHVSETISEQDQIDTVTGAYQYMSSRPEPYFFTNTYWIIANGHDPAWEEHALIRDEGPTALARALKKMASGGRV